MACTRVYASRNQTPGKCHCDMHPLPIGFSMHDERFFFHSFPRPKAGEQPLEKGLQMLAFMKEIGLVLAPEVVKWNASSLSTNEEEVQILQRRACFTEIARSEFLSTAGPSGRFLLRLT